MFTQNLGGNSQAEDLELIVLKDNREELFNSNLVCCLVGQEIKFCHLPVESGWCGDVVSFPNSLYVPHDRIIRAAHQSIPWFD